MYMIQLWSFLRSWSSLARCSSRVAKGPSCTRCSCARKFSTLGLPSSMSEDTFRPSAVRPRTALRRLVRRVSHFRARGSHPRPPLLRILRKPAARSTSSARTSPGATPRTRLSSGCPRWTALMATALKASSSTLLLSTLGSPCWVSGAGADGSVDDSADVASRGVVAGVGWGLVSEFCWTVRSSTLRPRARSPASACSARVRRASGSMRASVSQLTPLEPVMGRKDASRRTAAAARSYRARPCTRDRVLACRRGRRLRWPRW